MGTQLHLHHSKQLQSNSNSKYGKNENRDDGNKSGGRFLFFLF